MIYTTFLYHAMLPTGNDTLGGKILAGNTRAINLILNMLFFGLYSIFSMFTVIRLHN